MKVDSSQLADFPGAPFTQKHIDAVVAKLQRALGWHVGPNRAETLKVRHTVFSDMLMLPSRNVTAVAEVRGPSGIVTGWQLNSAGEAMLEGCWPAGRYEVDVTHGFSPLPADLLGEVARACVEFRTDPTLASWSSGPFSASMRSPGHRSGPSATFYAYAATTGV
jgi:hypothetical protein